MFGCDDDDRGGKSRTSKCTRYCTFEDWRIEFAQIQNPRVETGEGMTDFVSGDSKSMLYHSTVQYESLEQLTSDDESYSISQ
jgi:hypothetical protein